MRLPQIEIQVEKMDYMGSSSLLRHVLTEPKPRERWDISIVEVTINFSLYILMRERFQHFWCMLRTL